MAVEGKEERREGSAVMWDERTVEGRVRAKDERDQF